MLGQTGELIGVKTGPYSGTFFARNISLVRLVTLLNYNLEAETLPIILAALHCSNFAKQVWSILDPYFKMGTLA